jgi:hypothetical protein
VSFKKRNISQNVSACIIHIHIHLSSQFIIMQIQIQIIYWYKIENTRNKSITKDHLIDFYETMTTIFFSVFCP